MVRLHDDLLAELKAKGTDLKVYLRDRINRCLMDKLGEVPGYFFVIENRSKTGKTIIHPHIHGSIEIPRAPLPTTMAGEPRIRYRVMAKRDGIEHAELVRGEELVREALEQASGNDGSRPGIVNERSQHRNVWMDEPMFPIFNASWVDYSFKNTPYASRLLPQNRLVMSRSLNQEAQKLWRLIRQGEAAMDQWS